MNKILNSFLLGAQHQATRWNKVGASNSLQASERKQLGSFLLFCLLMFLALSAQAQTGICDRTQQVRDEIVRITSGVNHCADVTASHLASVSGLNLAEKRISALKSGDFAGLSHLSSLYLHENQLSSLPADLFAGLASLTALDLRENQLGSLNEDIFAGLSNLAYLYLYDNRLSSLDADLFDGLSNLAYLYLHKNQLSSLSADVFDGLTSLTMLNLRENQLASLDVDLFAGLSNLRGLDLSSNQLASIDADVFAGLSKLRGLCLNDNRLTSLPADVFAGLSKLNNLWLNNNQLSQLPAGLFDGLNLTVRLFLHGNSASPFVLDIYPEQVGNQVRVRIDEAAPREIRVNWAVGSSQTGTAIIAAGTRTSNAFGTDGIQASAVALSNPSLPGVSERTDENALTGNYTGFRLAVPEVDTAPSFGDATVAAQNHRVNTAVNLSLPAATGGNGTLTYSLAPNLPSSFSFDAATRVLSGQSATAVTATTYTLTVADEDGDTDALAFSFMVRIGICARTQQVRDEIVRITSGVDHCADVTASHLASVSGLNLAEKRISALKSGDFAGLNHLSTLYLRENQLSSLPANLFDELTSLTALDLRENQLGSLDEDMFAGLSNLAYLYLYDNRLSSLDADLFDGLSNLAYLHLHKNQLSSLSADVFDGLTSLTMLNLRENQLASLDVDLFAGLSNLRGLDLSSNQLAGIDADVFAGLSKLRGLCLNDNRLTSLPADVFAGLSKLNNLWLNNNQLSQLPAGLFDGLNLTVRLFLHGNSASPFVLDIYPEQAGNQVRVRIDEAAPRELRVSWAVGSSQTSTAVIAAGTRTSNAFGTTGIQASAVALSNPRLPGVSERTDENALTGYYTGFRLAVPEVDTAPSFGDATVAAQNHRVNTAVNLSLPAATGGNGTLTYSLAPNLPSSFSFDAATRVLSGQSATAVTATTYTLTVADEDGDTDALAFSFMVRIGICDRTQQVRDEIVRITSGVDHCADVTASHLASVSGLNLAEKRISALKSGDFAGLSNLAYLYLYDNRLSSLDADLFDGLSNLVYLYLHKNQLSSLSADVFDGLTSLTVLNLRENQLASLDVDLFDGLSNLRGLDLSSNQLASIDADLFAGLGKLRGLCLNDNRLTSLPADVFAGLSKLNNLWLNNNQLSQLPAGLFDGLNLTVRLFLHGNSVSPFVLDIYPEQAGNQVRVRIDEAAPRELRVNWAVGSSQTSTAVIAAGTRTSNAFGTDGVQASAVALSNPSLPGVSERTDENALTGYYTGFRLAVPEVDTTPSFGDATVDAQSYPVDVQITSLTLPAAYGNGTLSYTLMPNPPAGLSFVSSSRVLSGTPTVIQAETAYTLTATDADDNTGTLNFTITVTPVGICDRTKQVRDEIVRLTTGVTDCLNITATHLAAVPTLELGYKNISALQVGDFAGLNNLKTLRLYNNQLSSLDADLFDGLSNLTRLSLNNNRLSSLNVDLFDDLGNLETLWLTNNQLTQLEPDLFDGPSNLEGLFLEHNQLGSLTSADLFNGLNKLQVLNLNHNRLSSLHVNLFDGLDSLVWLNLGDNQLSSLPADLFDGLNKLTRLSLVDNRLSSLDADLFDGLTKLRRLLLSNNLLSQLPAGLFDGLNLTDSLYLAQRTDQGTDPGTRILMPLNVYPEHSGDQVQARIDQAAPREIHVTWTASGGSSETGVAVIPAGARTSTPFATAGSQTVTFHLSNPKLAGVTERIDDFLGGKYSGFRLTVPAAPAGRVTLAARLSFDGETVAAQNYMVGTAINLSLPMAAGGSGELSYAFSPNPPVGLSVDPQTCVLSGRPTSATAKKTHTLTATDADGNTAKLSFDIKVVTKSARRAADVSGDGDLSSADALVMYYAFEFEEMLGNGQPGSGNPHFRQILLSGLVDPSRTPNPTDADYRSLLRKAYAWKNAKAGGDLNNDGIVDGDDALIMYYTYELGLVDNREAISRDPAARRTLLNRLLNQRLRNNPNDEHYMRLLHRAQQLRNDLNN